MKNPFAEAL